METPGENIISDVYFVMFAYNYLGIDLSSLAIETEPPRSPTRGRSESRGRKDMTAKQLKPLPESLEFDIK